MTINNKNKILFLWGFMGSGKTQTGRALANSLGFTFVDLDSFIEVQEGSSISRLYSKHGENDFRKLESECLLKVSKFKNSVVSTGGGTPIPEGNRLIMSESGNSIFLNVSFNILWERIEKSVETRPLVSRGRVELERLFNERLPGYFMADIIIEANHPVEDVIKKIKKTI